jgi:hypothetical protein
MSRMSVWLGVVGLLLASSAVGLCQVPQPAFPGYPVGVNPCKPQPRPEPVTSTVQVNVPLPPNPCAPPCGHPGQRCGFGCAFQPSQPVNVKVEVVVRPEAPKPCVPQTFCCENPPVFEPIFCQAAGLVQSLIAAPLALGEMFMAHPVPMPLPVPTPVPCWRIPVATCSPCCQPPSATGCMEPPYPPQVRCAPPGPPSQAKSHPVCGPGTARMLPLSGPYPQ